MAIEKQKPFILDPATEKYLEEIRLDEEADEIVNRLKSQKPTWEGVTHCPYIPLL